MLSHAWAGPLFVLALVGGLDSLFLLLVRFRKVRPDPSWLPSVCRMGPETCSRVVDSPYALFFGIPNTFFGIAWYFAVAAGAILWYAIGELPACPWFLGAAAVTTLVSARLAYALRFRLRVNCPLCYLAHIVNAVLLILILAACVP